MLIRKFAYLFLINYSMSIRHNITSLQDHWLQDHTFTTLPLLRRIFFALASSNRNHQFVFAVDKTFSVCLGHDKLLRFAQIDGFFRTGFFAQSAEDATQHIDFVNR